MRYGSLLLFSGSSVVVSRRYTSWYLLARLRRVIGRAISARCSARTLPECTRRRAGARVTQPHFAPPVSAAGDEGNPGRYRRAGAPHAVSAARRPPLVHALDRARGHGFSPVDPVVVAAGPDGRPLVRVGRVHRLGERGVSNALPRSRCSCSGARRGLAPPAAGPRPPWPPRAGSGEFIRPAPHRRRACLPLPGSRGGRQTPYFSFRQARIPRRPAWNQGANGKCAGLGCSVVRQANSSCSPGELGRARVRSYPSSIKARPAPDPARWPNRQAAVTPGCPASSGASGR